MTKTTCIFCVAVVLMLCGCSSHNNNSSIQGLTPAQAQHMSSSNANITSAKSPPLTANTRFAAGQLAEAQQNYDAAIHQYNAALKLNPEHLPSLYRLGVLYAQLKQYDKSIETWDHYIVASRYAPASYGNLGFCYELAGLPKKAEAAYQTGIDKDSHNSPCRTNYGLMLARAGRIQEAVRMWEPVLTKAEIDYNLASVFETTGRKEEARSEYRKALELDPSLQDARDRLSAIQ